MYFTPTESPPVSEPTDLATLIDTQIRAAGPISLSTYMRLCLTHPTLGYYKNADPLGTAGDFITAPEISQIFGELIGLWVAGTWQAMGTPAAIDLVELGPGRGTLMEDAMRVISQVPGLPQTIRLNLVETNTALIAEQKKRLQQYNPRWISEISELDDTATPLIIIANEFFDALPIKQIQKAGGNWHERLIGLKSDQRAWGLSPTPLPAEALPAAIRDAEDGAVWETSLIAREVMGDIAARLASRRGALLAIDYGYATTQTGDTFQAIERHAFADPLAHPGQADLTAHVDFEALAEAATNKGANALPLQTQKGFLEALGITQRTQTLQKANPAMHDSLAAATHRLIGEDQMGGLFKCLCVTAPGLKPYPFDGSVTEA